MKNFTSQKLTRAGIVAALYIALTVILAPISYGPIQFRVSEALCVLPLVFPETAVGLTIGCFISNLFGNGPLDLIFGTLATAVSATLTALIGVKCRKHAPRIIFGGLMPVIFNAVIVPFTFLTASDLSTGYFIGMLSVLGGEAAVIFTLGILCYFSSFKIKARVDGGK